MEDEEAREGRRPPGAWDDVKAEEDIEAVIVAADAARTLSSFDRALEALRARNGS